MCAVVASSVCVFHMLLGGVEFKMFTKDTTSDTQNPCVYVLVCLNFFQLERIRAERMHLRERISVFACTYIGITNASSHVATTKWLYVLGWGYCTVKIYVVLRWRCSMHLSTSHGTFSSFIKFVQEKLSYKSNTLIDNFSFSVLWKITKYTTYIFF